MPSFYLLCESADDPVVFSHGGNRRSTDFTGKRENNIRSVLSERLGKSQTTINKYLQHGEYVSDDVFKELIDANAPKGFFEATQKEKHRYASELISRQTASDEIIRLVSAKTLDWLQTGQTPIDTVILPPERAIEPQAPATQPAPSRIESNPPSRQPCEFKTPEATEPGTDNSTSTEDDIRSQLRRIGSELIAVADNDEITDEQQITILRDQIARLAAILQHLASRSTDEIEMKEDNGRWVNSYTSVRGADTKAMPSSNVHALLLNVLDHGSNDRKIRISREMQRMARPKYVMLDSSGYQLHEAENKGKRITFDSSLPMKHSKQEINLTPKHVMEAASIIRPDIVVGLDFPIRKVKTDAEKEAEFAKKLEIQRPLGI